MKRGLGVSLKRYRLRENQNDCLAQFSFVFAIIGFSEFQRYHRTATEGIEIK